MLCSGEQVTECLERAELQLVVELWFTETTFGPDPLASIQCVSARTLNLQFSPTRWYDSAYSAGLTVLTVQGFRGLQCRTYSAYSAGLTVLTVQDWQCLQCSAYSTIAYSAGLQYSAYSAVLTV